ncbi:cell division protein FtsL [Roseomonas fluvialis]|uniref:Cell division protein FtsL n=1 Tax=Roseomonas fluvialis TaxID=1750527 RepID=A0ABN6NYN8_9PROT|nr:hypothetical protein [Roseomonas fluvialis]BDG71121.1 hypothetical protein Rmf_10500 [Roseomonas fluvialis]
MIRPFTLLSMVAAAGAGLYLYQVKHSVAQLDRELRGINRQTEQARERTQVLRAEWALLNEPDRLRQVAQRHLALEAMTPAQFVRPAEMERRLPPPRQFAGVPSLFAPVEPAGDGSATAIALAAAAPRAPVAPAPAPPVAVAAAPAAAAPPPAAPAPAAAAPRPAAAEPAPAPVALAAAETPRPAPRPAAPRPAPPPAPVRAAMHVERPTATPAVAPQRVAAPIAAPTVVSALGGSGPALAPPVPIARAAAATLPGAR